MYRRLMFIDIGYDNQDALNQMEAAYVPWVHQHIIDQRYIGLFAMDNGAVAAMGGLLIMDNPPNPRSAALYRGYLLDVYTVPAYRQRGAARMVVQGIVDIAREMHLPRVELHASAAGRHLYETLGFVATNEMRLWLIEQ